jgi:hypothetical protein
MGPLSDEEMPPFLREMGFHVVERGNQGSSRVLLESDTLRVRFDMGQPKSAEVASLAEPDRWFGALRVMEALGNPGSSQDPDLSALADLIRRRYPEVVQRLGPGSVAMKVVEAVRRRGDDIPARSADLGRVGGNAGELVPERSSLLSRVLLWIVVLLAAWLVWRWYRG